MIVTTRHLFTIPGFSTRRGFCRSGARRWFAEHGIDWRTFVRDGIDEERLTATGDALAIALVEWAHKSEQENARG